MKEILKKVDKKKLILAWRIMPLALIVLILMAHLLYYDANEGVGIWKFYIFPVFYNLYFFFIFQYFLKNYFDVISVFKKNIFKILTFIYFITTLISLTVVLLSVLEDADILHIRIFKDMLLLIIVIIAPVYGIIYLLCLQLFPFLKKIKASIFNTEKRKLVWYDYLTAFIVPAIFTAMFYIISLFAGMLYLVLQ